MPTTEKEIRRVIRAWEQAIQAGDFDGILANHADDILMFDVPGAVSPAGLSVR